MWDGELFGKAKCLYLLDSSVPVLVAFGWNGQKAKRSQDGTAKNRVLSRPLWVCMQLMHLSMSVKRNDSPLKTSGYFQRFIEGRNIL